MKVYMHCIAYVTRNKFFRFKLMFFFIFLSLIIPCFVVVFFSTRPLILFFDAIVLKVLFFRISCAADVLLGTLRFFFSFNQTCRKSRRPFDQSTNLGEHIKTHCERIYSKLTIKMKRIQKEMSE